VTDEDRFRLVPIGEWDRLRRELERWCDGRVEADGDRIDCHAGSARFLVRRDGHVEAGMPLHELAREDVEAIGFDHDARELLLRGEGLRYVFRHP